MRKRRSGQFLSILLAVVLVLGCIALPGAGIGVEAAKKKKSSKTTAAKTAAAATTTATAAAATTAPSWSLSIPAALIQGNQIVVTVTGPVQATDDGLYHLYAQDAYMSGVQGTEVASAAAAQAQTFTFALNKNTASSMLYKKFVVAGTVKGTLTQLSNAQYITNPEATADHTTARMNVGKKGILPAAQWIQDTGRLRAMGVQQISYNLPLGDMITGGGINYTYNGKNYSFNAGIVGQYDIIVPAMNKAGISVSLILLCGANGGTLIHPLSRGVGANYYMMNTAEPAGLELLEAIASFLGERYSGNGHGTVDNWIVGNEVNARNEWNYMNPSAGLAGFTKAYADELRIFYNGIKSHNANANIFAATDQEWESDNPALHYGAKEFLTSLNAQITAEGNIDWSLSNHPYNFPLYEPNALTEKPQITHSFATSRYVTMQNIDILTDFMMQQQFLNPAGAVRYIELSEVGFTSSAAMGSNEQLQAADVVFAINQANANQYIKGIIINRQLSDVSEIAQGLDYGLLNPDGSAKLAYSWYTNATDPGVIATAGAVLGKDIASAITVR